MISQFIVYPFLSTLPPYLNQRIFFKLLSGVNFIPMLPMYNQFMIKDDIIPNTNTLRTI
jgi:hypothetical protein